MKTFFGRRRWYFFIPIVLVGVTAFVILTMLLWNALLPGIFHVTQITFWQAAGLLLLARILFGGGGPHKYWPHHHWRSHFREKWEHMTPEERKQFSQHWHQYRPPWAGCCTDEPQHEKKEDSNIA